MDTTIECNGQSLNTTHSIELKIKYFDLFEFVQLFDMLLLMQSNVELSKSINAFRVHWMLH